MELWSEIYGFVEKQWGSIAILIGTVMTGLFTLQASNRKTAVDARKLSIDADAAARKLRSEEAEAVWRREEAVNQRYEAMLARLERQLETQNSKIDDLKSKADEADERATKERHEMRSVIDTQAGEMGVMRSTMVEMKSYMAVLADYIRKLGHEPPKPPREW